MIPFKQIAGYTSITGAEEPEAAELMVQPCSVCGAYPRYNYFNVWEPEEHTLECEKQDCENPDGYSIFSQAQLIDNWNSKNNS